MTTAPAAGATGSAGPAGVRGPNAVVTGAVATGLGDAAAGSAPAVTASPPLLALDDVHRHYPLPRTRLFAPRAVVRAVDGVSLAVHAGRSLGLVGESGSGKSTLARLAMALEAPDAGRVRFLGQDLNALPAADLRRARRDFQMVFQDPYGSLDPRQRVGRIVAEPLRAQGGDRQGVHAARVAEALDAVGLRDGDAAKYPHEFSGGQRQRIAIARALVTRPKLIVADEPVSALDVSVQAQVLNLLADLQRDHGVTYLFISHDLAVVEHACDDVAVLWRGRVVEEGPAAAILRAASHPYTRALLEAVPRAPDAATRGASAATAGDAAHGLSGAHNAYGVPSTQGTQGAQDIDQPATIRRSPLSPDAATGCTYAPRCPHADARCLAETPLLRPSGAVRVACHHAEAVRAA